MHIRQVGHHRTGRRRVSSPASLLSYDAAGNLQQQQDANGQMTSDTSNDANQLTQISYADGRTVTLHGTYISGYYRPRIYSPTLGRFLQMDS